MSGRNIGITVIAIVIASLGVGGILLMKDSSIQDGRDVVTAMYERYADKWYPYLTFRQETIYYKNGEPDFTQTWYEALAMPGKLTIKFDSLTSASGIVFRQDTQYVVQNNEVVRAIPRVHDLLVLGFDVYALPPGQIIPKLEKQGFDLSKMYETDWQGRPVYVVGAEGEDDDSPQFWVDQEHLYFVRLIRTNQQSGKVQETEFNKYERIGGGWVAPEVVFKSDGEVVLLEEYYEMNIPASLPASVFDPHHFQQIRW
jgi:hypothetical protein